MPTQSKAGRMRHVVNVMRPAPPQGEGTPPEPTILMKEVPCSIEQLSGREAERMQQMYATATMKVGMYGDPNKRLKNTDWLLVYPLESKRRLNIMAGVNGVQQNGIELELICGEETS